MTMMLGDAGRAGIAICWVDPAVSVLRSGGDVWLDAANTPCALPQSKRVPTHQ